jgi:phage tail sheath protein FI
MFCYAANTLIVNNWAKLDGKLVQRRIESMVNDTNVWLNGLASREHILGGRLEFRQEDNSTADLMDGKVVFRLYITPPSPIRDIEFVLEYDTSYVATLFG